MKLIDLLVKIANKEELPKKIKFEDDVYVLSEYKHIYMTENKMCCLLGTINFDGSNLNTDVEIVTDIKTIEDETDYFEIEKIDVELLNQISNIMDNQWIKLDYLTKKFLKEGYYFTYICDDKCVIIDTFNNDNTIYLDDEKVKECLKGDSNE